jgi:hypothetical protein
LPQIKQRLAVMANDSASSCSFAVGDARLICERVRQSAKSGPIVLWGRK